MKRILLILILCAHSWAAVSHVKVLIQTATNSGTIQASNANDAIVVGTICQNNSNTPSLVVATAPGWTFAEVGTISGTTGVGWAAEFSAIAPGTNSTSLTVTWTVVGGCLFTSVMGDEFTGNDTTGGATTFDATGTLFANSSSGACDFTSVKPGNDNDALWGECAPLTSISAVGSGFTKGADDGAGDWTEWKILGAGTSGVSQRINFTSTGGWVSFGMTIKAAGSAVVNPGSNKAIKLEKIDPF